MPTVAKGETRVSICSSANDTFEKVMRNSIDLDSMKIYLEKEYTNAL